MSLHGLARMNKVLLVFVFALVVVECAEVGDVSFKGMQFTITCPYGENITWSRGPADGRTLTTEYNETNKGEYKCSSTYTDTEITEHYYFYVQGKVCENCYELDGSVLIGLIGMDLLVTGGIVILIYNCTRRKSASGPSTAPASRRPVRSSAPSVPDRDYEQLSHATRDRDTYAVPGVNRTG
ncbi:hypothetical protein COCON_G00186880 [Conger conger]|uniref:T-cell surface glycoprotein CD3 epsilon chain n=1 Tax=Conger conger TaxID=82655 RepID=A0A9Q1D2C3_CONCO|nr:hypothetical protein COCON_G00186880 [Conger conger]